MPTPEASLHEILTALSAEVETDTRPTTGGCALCRLIARSVEQSLRAFFAEFVNDPQAREELRQAGGFCAEHAALLATLGDALAVAILYSDLTRLTRERWLENNGRKGRRWQRGGKRSLAPCPGCADAEAAQTRYVGAFAAGLGEVRVWEALEASKGLCTAHAEQIMALATPAQAERLRQSEATRLAALQAELAEIIRKNDYRFRGEAWGEEKDAWLRALKKITRR